MSLHLDERADGGFALYIEGDFQFDTADEPLYHESMALPALCLARQTNPDSIRVLICGGGDGLALRECLRFPGVTQVDLVDYSPEVVALGRSRFAGINLRAFEDPRVTVHIADAWEFLNEAAPYDVILCDFTVPRAPEDTRIFSQEWYARLKQALTPGGMLALNGVSPQTTPEAFWCLRKTVRAAGLSALPYRVCIPSFRAHGYGPWAFLLASRQPLASSSLRSLACPVPALQADLTKLWRGARFRRIERDIEKRVPVHTLANGCLLNLLLNPGSLLREEEEKREESRTEASSSSDPIENRKSKIENPPSPAPYDLEPLLRAIPISHPYHTRLMVETLAQQVVGVVRELDIQRLVEALLRRAAALPRDLLKELTRLRDFLRERVFNLETFGAWSFKLFATLVLLMTLANTISPDNAFAKGSAGLGHASMSRGYSGSFGGSRGISGGEGRTTGSSFSGSRGFGSLTASGSRGSFGSGKSVSSFGGTRSFGRGSLYQSSASTRILNSGFRSSYGLGRPVDISGQSYSSRTFFYGNGYGYSHTYYIVGNSPREISTGSTAPAPGETHQALFVADDDMIVLDNGDVVITLSDSAYLLLTQGTVLLMANKSSDPLLPLYPDPALFQSVGEQLDDQHIEALQAIEARQDWLSWVGWTGALMPVINADRTELKNFQDLARRLETAYERLGKPPEKSLPAPVQAVGQVELFVGCVLLPNGSISLRGPDNQWLTTDGKQITSSHTGVKAQPCPPLLTTTLNSVLLKLQKEFTADLAAQDDDLRLQASDRTSLENDLKEYQGLDAANGGNGTYEVDYGTDEISVSDAISRTQRDLDQNQNETKEMQKERDKMAADLLKIQAALNLFKV